MARSETLRTMFSSRLRTMLRIVLSFDAVSACLMCVSTATRAGDPHVFSRNVRAVARSVTAEPLHAAGSTGRAKCMFSTAAPGSLGSRSTEAAPPR